jgi:integrase
MSKGLIRVSEEIAKNDHSSFRTIPKVMFPFLLNLNLSAPSNFFLFGNYEDYCFKPGIKAIDTKKIGKYWEKLRKELDIPKNITFYSLKDTGIIQMSRDGVSWKDIQDQADHSSGDITRIYARYREPGGSQQIRERASTFGAKTQEDK